MTRRSRPFQKRTTRSRRKSPNRRLLFEGLERRELLSADVQLTSPLINATHEDTVLLGNGSADVSAPQSTLLTLRMDDKDPRVQVTGDVINVTEDVRHGPRGAQWGPYRLVKAGRGESSVTYPFDGLAPGTYEVAESWVEYSDRGSNVPHEIYDGEQLIATVRVDQRELSSGITLDVDGYDTQFKSLGTFEIRSGKVSVRITNDCDGWVSSSYVVLWRLQDVPLDPPAIDTAMQELGQEDVGAQAHQEPVATIRMDDKDPRVQVTGNVINVTEDVRGGPRGAQWGPYRLVKAGGGESSLTYPFDGLAPGTYEVAESWVEYSDRGSNVPHEIYDGDQLIATVRVDQRELSSGITLDVDGYVTQFKSLGTFEIQSGKLSVRITNDCDGWVSSSYVVLRRLRDVPVDLHEEATDAAIGQVESVEDVSASADSIVADPTLLEAIVSAQLPRIVQFFAEGNTHTAVFENLPVGKFLVEDWNQENRTQKVRYTPIASEDGSLTTSFTYSGSGSRHVVFGVAAESGETMEYIVSIMRDGRPEYTTPQNWSASAGDVADTQAVASGDVDVDSAATTAGGAVETDVVGMTGERSLTALATVLSSELNSLLDNTDEIAWNADGLEFTADGSQLTVPLRTIGGAISIKRWHGVGLRIVNPDYVAFQPEEAVPGTLRPLQHPKEDALVSAGSDTSLDFSGAEQLVTGVRATVRPVVSGSHVTAYVLRRGETLAAVRIGGDGVFDFSDSDGITGVLFAASDNSIPLAVRELAVEGDATLLQVAAEDISRASTRLIGLLGAPDWNDAGDLNYFTVADEADFNYVRPRGGYEIPANAKVIPDAMGDNTLYRSYTLEGLNGSGRFAEVYYINHNGVHLLDDEYYLTRGNQTILLPGSPRFVGFQTRGSGSFFVACEESADIDEVLKPSGPAVSSTGEFFVDNGTDQFLDHAPEITGHNARWQPGGSVGVWARVHNDGLETGQVNIDFHAGYNGDATDPRVRSFSTTIGGGAVKWLCVSVSVGPAPYPGARPTLTIVTTDQYGAVHTSGRLGIVQPIKSSRSDGGLTAGERRRLDRIAVKNEQYVGQASDRRAERIAEIRTSQQVAADSISTSSRSSSPRSPETSNGLQEAPAAIVIRYSELSREERLAIRLGQKTEELLAAAAADEASDPRVRQLLSTTTHRHDIANAVAAQILGEGLAERGTRPVTVAEVQQAIEGALHEEGVSVEVETPEETENATASVADELDAGQPASDVSEQSTVREDRVPSLGYLLGERRRLELERRNLVGEFDFALREIEIRMESEMETLDRLQAAANTINSITDVLNVAKFFKKGIKTDAVTLADFLGTFVDIPVELANDATFDSTNPPEGNDDSGWTFARYYVDTFSELLKPFLAEVPDPAFARNLVSLITTGHWHVENAIREIYDGIAKQKEDVDTYYRLRIMDVDRVIEQHYARESPKGM